MTEGTRRARAQASTADTAGAGGGLAVEIRDLDISFSIDGGEVHAASPGPGLGSTFTLELPLLPPLSPLRARELESSPALAIDGSKILIADDEAVERLEEPVG